MAGQRASSARSDLAGAAHFPGFGAGAPRRTGAASSASVHVAPRASTGSGAGSLMHPERAKSHGQWEAAKQAAQRARDAGFASWRERERAEQERRAEGGAGRAAADVRAGGAEAGWAGLGHTDWSAVTKRRQPRRAPRIENIVAETVDVGDTSAAGAAGAAEAEVCSLREHARRFHAAGNTAKGGAVTLARLGEVAGAGPGAPAGPGSGVGGAFSARRRATKSGTAGAGSSVGSGAASSGAGDNTGGSVTVLKSGLRDNGNNRPA